MFDSYRLMTPAQAQEFVSALQDQEWETGKARTAEATGTIKKNEEIKETTHDAGKVLVGQIKKLLAGHPSLYVDHTVRRVFAPKFNRYSNGGEYQRHGDAAMMGGQVRTDLSCTIFLSHPDTYEGGDLCIEGNDGGFHSVKGDPGTAVVYPCHMPHWVTPVTSGERICCITWFESCYRDEEKRNLMRRFLRYLKEMEAEDDLRYKNYHVGFGSIHSKLQRMWLEYEPLPPQRQ